MDDLRNILKEEYNKKASTVDVRTLMEMVEEIMGL